VYLATVFFWSGPLFLTVVGFPLALNALNALDLVLWWLGLWTWLRFFLEWAGFFLTDAGFSPSVKHSYHRERSELIASVLPLRPSHPQGAPDNYRIFYRELITDI
jgi:hypothetical protein